LRPTIQECRVDPAKPERVAERVLNTGVTPLARNVVEITARIRVVEIDGRRQPMPLQRERADRRLERTRCAKGVAVVPLGAAHLKPTRMIAEGVLEGERFRWIVEWRRATMGVDVCDVRWRDVTVVEGAANGPRCLRAVRTRRGHVMRVIRVSITNQLGVDVCAAGMGPRILRQHGDGTTLP